MKKSAASAPFVSSPLANVLTAFQQIFSCSRGCGSSSSTFKTERSTNNEENYSSPYKSKSTSNGSLQESYSLYPNLTPSVDESREFRGKVMVMAPFDEHNDIHVMKTTWIEDETIWLELEPSSSQMS